MEKIEFYLFLPLFAAMIWFVIEAAARFMKFAEVWRNEPVNAGKTWGPNFFDSGSSTLSEECKLYRKRYEQSYIRIFLVLLGGLILSLYSKLSTSSPKEADLSSPLLHY